MRALEAHEAVVKAMGHEIEFGRQLQKVSAERDREHQQQMRAADMEVSKLRLKQLASGDIKSAVR